MPQKQKLAMEEKVSLIRRYLKGEISISLASKLGNVDPATVRSWIRLYEVEGEAAFLPRERNRVYSPELKLAAVRAYLDGKGSQQAICKKYGIRSKIQLQNWIKEYNAHGDFNSVKLSGGSYMRQGRQTTPEERIRIARECIASGRNYGEMALKYEVSYYQVRSWTLRFEEMGEAGLEDRRGKRKKDQAPRSELERLQIENEQLKHKLYLAEMERDLLKKLNEIEGRDAFRK